MSDFGFTVSQVEELSNMLNPNGDDDTGHVYGSALNPATLHGKKEDKELAKPGVKMSVAVNNRNKTGGAIISED